MEAPAYSGFEGFLKRRQGHRRSGGLADQSASEPAKASLAVAQHGRQVAQPLDVGHVVGDQDGRLALLLAGGDASSCSSFRAARSMPSVGSSSTSNSGSLTRAWASASRCNMPLLKAAIGSRGPVGQADLLQQPRDALVPTGGREPATARRSNRSSVAAVRYCGNAWLSCR